MPVNAKDVNVFGAVSFQIIIPLPLLEIPKFKTHYMHTINIIFKTQFKIIAVERHYHIESHLLIIYLLIVNVVK